MWPPAEATRGTRRTMPSTSGERLTSPKPLAASARAGTTPTSPGKPVRNCLGSRPSVATREAASLMPGKSGLTRPIPATPRTTAWRRMARAIAVSLSGRAWSAAAISGASAARDLA